LPASIYKKLGIQPGQKLLLEVQGDKIILSPKTTSYTELLAGSIKDIYGRTLEEVNAYIRKEREPRVRLGRWPLLSELKLVYF
jgi:bifunctional DNA-binding transcriptional regulator/antitoxin component of YhaV-PrlF toxin-antitoxin module